VRKYLAIVLGALLVISFAATAFAMDTDIKLGGKIIVSGWYVQSVTDGLPSDRPDGSSSSADYTTEASITVDATVAENVKGFMELETSAWDDQHSGEFQWGNPGYDAKPGADLYFRQLWIMYTGSGLLGVPAGIKVGHMPLALGEKVFINNERFGDDAIVMWVDPTKELHIAGVMAKLNEGDFNDHGDDVDGYVLLLDYALDKDNTIGINGTYINADDECPSVGVVDGVNFWDFGIHGNGNISGLAWALEADIQTGGADGVAALGGVDLDAKGWAVLAKLGYMIDPINIRGSFAYGSGDDDANDRDCEEFQTLNGPDDIQAQSRLVHYTQIYERWINTAAFEQLLTTTPGGNVRNTGIANTTLFNLGLDWSATQDLNLALDGFYLMASETGAWEDTLGRNVSDELGWELDLKGEYKIAKNLTYFVEAGFLWPGDFYKDVHGVDENVTQLMHGLMLTF
jgi:hypothetical protein